MKRFQLRSKEMAEELKEYSYTINKKDNLEKIEDKVIFLFINKQPCFFYYQGKPVPTLKLLQEKKLLKTVTIDMGAVKFIINGADVMRPGIVEVEAGIQKNEYVAIIDVNNKKPLAVGRALFSGDEIRSMSSGKVIQNIHFVGDEIWKFQL